MFVSVVTYRVSKKAASARRACAVAYLAADSPLASTTSVKDEERLDGIDKRQARGLELETQHKRGANHEAESVQRERCLHGAEHPAQCAADDAATSADAHGETKSGAPNRGRETLGEVHIEVAIQHL